MPTWDDVHAGDIVIGHDGLLYGVAGIEHDPARGPSIGLRRYGERFYAQPPPSTPIRIWAQADTVAERGAWQMLSDAGLDPQILGEWNG